MNAQIAHLERPGDAWPPLVPLDTPELPALHADWLPSWAGDFAAALAAETETPAELPAALVLASCATAAARRLRVLVRPGWFEPCNLWLVCALPPGNRKSAVQRAACEPLMTWERQQARDMDAEIKRADSDRKTQEARAKALRAKAASEKDRANARQLAEEAADIEEALVEVPKVPQLWTSDATPERLGMLLADNGERMAWLSSEGGVFDLLGGRYSSGIPNLDLVLKAHSGDFERVDRGSRPPVHLHCPLLSIGLAPQPEVLRGLMTKPGFHGRGLLARFLYLLPPSPLGYRSGEGQPVPDAARAAYTEGLRRMLEWPAKTDDHGEERPHLLRLEAEAAAELREFSQHIETSMRPGGACEHATDWAGKAPGTAARIAGVLHGIQHAHGEPWEHAITGETMQQALSIMATCMKHSLAAHDLMGADGAIAGARRVWRWAEGRRRPRFTVREAFEALKGTFPRVAQLREALEVLEERGYIEVTEPERDGPGRKPSPLVQVRPDIVEGWR